MVGMKDYIPFVRQMIGTRKFFCCWLVDWDSKREKFVPVNWKMPKLVVSSLFDIFYYAMSIRRVLRITSDSTENGGGTLQNMPSVMLTYGGLLGMIMNFSAIKNSELFASLMNAIIVLEEPTGTEEMPVTKMTKAKSPQSGWQVNKECFWLIHRNLGTYIRDRNRGRILLTAGFYTDLTFWSLPIAVLFLTPCLVPVFLRSTLADCPLRGGDVGFESTFLYKTIFFLIDWIGFSHGYFGGSFAGAVTFPLIVFSIGEHTWRLEKAMSKVKPNKEAWKKLIDKYRLLKVLEIIYNDMNQSGITILLLMDLTGCAIMATFSGIALSDRLPLPMLLFLSVMAFDCNILAQLVDFQGAGNVHHYSLKVQELWKSSEYVRRDKYLSRSTTALNALKIRLGKSGNFLENGTPLVNIQFTMDQVVSLILATK